MIKVALIIPAGGVGARMKTSVPKTLMQLAGKPIIYWTIRRFCQVDEIFQIIIPSHESIKNQIQSIATDAIADSGRTDIKFQVIDGGKERLHSINNAIPFVLNDVELVAVHDAVRPFVSKSVIESCIIKAQESDAVIPALPLRETIKEVNREMLEVISTPDRSKFWSVQTPQIFRKSLFVNAYEYAVSTSFFGTDDASVVEYFGKNVSVCEGNNQNIKITYPIDFEMAKLLIEKENYD
ncbi:2-C-methyl-D-erythritol 4-phosphate cytidylyltransferase [bacterium]|nr:MAG: 2-C-methyl-D-erythritol 4-phosphate cytidylyltransferase [bacterium]